MDRKALLLVISFCISACAGNRLDAEQENLEKPPRIVDFSTYNEKFPEHAAADKEAAGDSGASSENYQNFDVVLTNQGGQDTSLAIVQPYEQAWSMVAKALQHEAFDVTDRDRGAGVFYVTYDPDYQKSAWQKTLSFFSGNAEAISDFQLKLTDVDTITEITAELIADEDEDNYVDPDDEVERFLLVLYKILRKQ